MGRVDDASQLFRDGNSCSQAVFVAFAPGLGIDRSVALRLASGLGGGMRIGGTCGAATGATLVLGLRYGRGDDADARHEVTAAVEKFYARFTREVGATDCPAILGCDFRTPEGQALMKEKGLRESTCLPAVRAAAAILDEMLEPDSRDV